MSLLAGQLSSAQMNQVDHIGGLFPPSTMSACQLFEPANAAFNAAAMDDFLAPGTTAFTQVRCAFQLGNTATIPSSITGWRVTIWRTFYGASYSNGQFNGEFGPALLVHWPVASFFLPATYQILTNGLGNAWIATITLPGLLLPPGTYYLAAVPRLDFVPHGQVFVLGNSNPAQPGGGINNGFWVNPGQGFGGPPPPAPVPMNTNVALSIQ